MRSHVPRMPARFRAPRHRAPSTSGYMITAAAAAAALFFVLWWMLQSEEYPWVPAGLAASVFGLSPSIMLGGIGVLAAAALIGRLVPSLREYDRSG